MPLAPCFTHRPRASSIGATACYRADSGICTIAGCGTNVKARGLCFQHGAYGVCSVAGCSTNTVARDLCVKHGAKDASSVAGCSTNAAARGLTVAPIWWSLPPLPYRYEGAKRAQRCKYNIDIVKKPHI